MKLLLLCSLIVSSFLSADNFQNTLIIPSVNLNQPFWEFSCGQAIAQIEDGAFKALVEKWNINLNSLWIRLKIKIKEDIHATAEQIDYYLESTMFQTPYLAYCNEVYSDIIAPENVQEIDAYTLNFIKLKFNFLMMHKPCSIYKQDFYSFLSHSFGTNKNGHYLIINEMMYNAEKIKELYQLTCNKQSAFMVQPATTLYRSRVIEISNLLHFGIAQAISSIIHQADYFSKILRIFSYNKVNLSTETQRYGSDYTIFRSWLEATLQSKNPLEAARYLEPQANNLMQDFSELWDAFITDLESCYNPEDLAAYEAVALLERQSALFTHVDE